ncbi:MAG TPA: HAD-IA family hydrolase [Candidatus Saccharimonadales bacterium]|nr:HAD-IA family hydrolase [Candidatus Saccharimonadales bacterium]
MDERGLGKKLQQARQAAGLTQQQLCQRANLSFSTLTKIERGAIKAPSIFTIQAIATALGQSLDELVGSAPVPVKTYKKTQSGVSFLYFDINGSLVHFFHRAFTQIATDNNVPADLVESSFWHFNDDACRGTLSLNDFNQAMSQRLGIASLDFKQYYLDAVEAVEPLQDLLKWASEHYRVGILSNIMPGFISAMIANGTLPNLRYDAIVDSSEVGTIKPEERIYEIATERAGVPPEEIMLIDDTRTNLVPAEWLGWKVMLFDDYQMEESISKLRAALEPAD